MTGPKTFNAAIRASHERESHKRGLAKVRNSRKRKRDREGYALMAPADVPPEIVWTLVDKGFLGADDVTRDGNFLTGGEGGTPRVDPKVLSQAICLLFDVMAAKPIELGDLITDNIPIRDDGERQITSIRFLQEIGLNISGAAMRADDFLKALENHGFEVTIKKKSLGDK